ncbi:MAG: NAD(P)H-dependent glycerol-3-phosphate dehydrogenase [Deltaproteobacteria bacterium]|nr:NAD(P)H-dependent glycerol-3-phosphate dehydrogenase [Deltaproteobacteria bacterium]
MKITVLGAGSWGTALAKVLGDKGHQVHLWSRRAEQAAAIRSTQRNDAFLPEIVLPATLTATHDLEEALDQADMLLVAVPTHGLREILPRVHAIVRTPIPVISATKGIEQDTLMLVHQVIEDEIPWTKGMFVGLSGPSFAMEVALGQPTVVVAAATDAGLAREVQRAFFSDGSFRVYLSTDVLGVELGGALKNVIAIGAGASDGMGFGNNARAALITRGLSEIARLAVHLGAEPMTLAGLAGMGDLVLTCSGSLSRNRHVGFELGRGRKLTEILGDMRQVAEGVRTTKSAFELAQREGVSMPIVEQVYRVLYEDKDPKAAVWDLMVREASLEFLP